MYVAGVADAEAVELAPPAMEPVEVAATVELEPATPLALEGLDELDELVVPETWRKFAQVKRVVFDE